MPFDPERAARDVAELAPALREVATNIHGSPELRFQEQKAAAWLAEAVEREGVAVERALAGLPTAFRARAGRPGRARVAILAEYDALPVIGHACGHNLIAGGALGAFLALARQADAIGGQVELVGTPAEEGGGGKIRLLERGVFEGVDAAIMFHPFDRDLTAHFTLANKWVSMTFRGKASHAALAPWDGASALTACLDTFRLVDGQRVHFRDGVRVHGFIKHGGDAVNIIPERAEAEFSVRARTLAELERVQAIVERCARGAAMAGGVEVEVVAKEGYKNLVTNLPLARRMGDKLRELGRDAAETDDDVGAGSTDMGDVSHAVPSLHAWLAICDRGAATCHQQEFVKCAASERGFESMGVAAVAMARLAADVLADARFRGEIAAAFAAR
ncbi:MAG TPA: M20 family metallopeptidase [Byssovorax sp.]|jgi:amidohydrolase